MSDYEGYGSDYDPDGEEYDGYAGEDDTELEPEDLERQESEGIGGLKFDDLVSAEAKAAYRRYNPIILEREAPYEIIECKNAWPALVDAASEISPTLYVPVPDTIQLLLGMGFDRRALEQKWIDDREGCLKAAHMLDPADYTYVPKTAAAAKSVAASSSGANVPPSGGVQAAMADDGDDTAAASGGGEEEDMCMICFGMVPKSKMDAPPCGHGMCQDCWRQHIEVATGAKGGFLHVGCAEQGCGIRLPYAMLQQYLSPAQMERWQRWAGSDFAKSDEGMRQCPNPKCDRLHYYSKAVPIDVHCPLPACGHISCFACSGAGHFPATCKMAKKWMDKTAKDSASVAFIRDSTRPCPRCGLPIEKNQGCMQMQCGKHAHGGKVADGYGCGLVFCWVCMQPYDNHTNCKPWNPDKAYTGKGAMSKSELGRFIDAASLYENHQTAQKAAIAMRERVQKTQEEIQLVRKRPREEVVHLERALQEVEESRRILANQCVFAFYQYKDPRLKLFSEQEKQLSDNVDRLQQLLEGKPGELPVSELFAFHDDGTQVLADKFNQDRIAVRTLTANTREYREGLSKAVSVAGLEADIGAKAGAMEKLQAGGGGAAGGGGGGGGSGGGAAGGGGVRRPDAARSDALVAAQASLGSFASQMERALQASMGMGGK